MHLFSQWNSSQKCVTRMQAWEHTEQAQTEEISTK
jgi:hypothetical protein